MDVYKQMEELIRETASEAGKELSADLEEVAGYAAERAGYLSTLVGDPGFKSAVIAERDNVALRAGIQSTLAADAADARIVGAVGGALRIAAVALSALP